MSKKETLERLDEKFLTNPKSRMCYLNGDEKRELVKFVEEEIKLAREETIMEVEEILPGEANIHTEFPVGWNNCRREALNRINKLKKYETIRTI